MRFSTNADPGCTDDGLPRQTTYGLTYNDGDVSSGRGWGCDGCDNNIALRDWPITRLEMWDDPDADDRYYSLSTTGAGWLTAYKQPDGTYELVSTLRIGDPFIHQGTCIRAPPTSDEFSCASPLTVSRTEGKHLLTCVSILLLSTTTIRKQLGTNMEIDFISQSKHCAAIVRVRRS